MTPNNLDPHPGPRASQRFGIRRPGGEWYIGQDEDDDEHRWGPAESAGVWLTLRYAESALRSLGPALARTGFPADELAELRVERLPGANRWTPDFTALPLNALGNRGLAAAVTPSPFDENPDGAVLWLALFDGPLAITLTHSEARRLAEWLIDVLDTPQ